MKLTNAMVNAGAKVLDPFAWETDEYGNYIWLPVKRCEARKQAREIIVAALKASKPLVKEVTMFHASDTSGMRT